MPRKPRIAVIGAGPAGLAAAFALGQRGAEVEVFEASPHVGGLGRSLSLWGRPVDLGPHIFAGGHRGALTLWGQLLGRDRCALSLRRGIATRGVVLEYPVRALDVARKLPTRQLLAPAAGYIFARARNLVSPSRAEERSAEAVVVARYGRPLYDLLLRSYVEKLWGLRGTEVDAAFARALLGVEEDPGARRTVPARATFEYPRGGTGAAWKELAARVGRFGVVRTDAPVDELLVDAGRVQGLRALGEERGFDAVISSLPLRRLVGMLPPPPLEVRLSVEALRVRHALLVHLRIRAAPRAPHLWVYLYDARLRAGRLTDWRSWHPEEGMSADTVVTLEYWCSDRDTLWSTDDFAVLAAAAQELRESGVYRELTVLDGQVTRLFGVLPVPTLGYAAHVRGLRDYAASFRGLHTIGRHGSFLASSMADSAGEGLDVAESLISTSPR